MASPVLLDERDPAPAVVTWYRIYAGFMAALYALTGAGGLAMMIFHRQLAESQNESSTFWLVYGGFLFVVGLLFMAPFLAAFFVPRKPWVWIYHMVLICIGLSSPCCMMASVPLLIFWLKPEVRVYYGRAPR